MSTTSVQPPSSHIVNKDDTTSIVPGNDHSTVIEQSNSNEEDTTVHNNKTTSTTKKRTRATAEQLAVLEDTFAVNVSPNSKLRKQLAERLQMSERSIQIWFQNRRAKVKHMQKRAQMQMQQASIRAQLYHYHQQQYGAHPYGNHHPHHQQQQHHHHHPHHQQQHHGPPLMPLQPHQQQQQQQHYYRPQQQAYPTPSSARVPLPRAQSVDTIQQHNPVQLPTSTATPPPSHIYYPPTHPHQQWSENTPVESSPTSITTPTHPYNNNSTIPTLVPVPDAGPTAMLTTSDFNYGPSTPATTPPAPSTMTSDLWCAPDAFDRAQSCSLAVSDPTTGELVSPVRALSDPIVTTIDPSSLMMTPPATSASSSSTTTSSSSESSQTSLQSTEQQQSQLLDDKNTSNNNHNNNNNNDTSLNATTLTIGSWHRLKLRANDLLCVYQPERRMFAWHIADAGSLFRMEISLDAVASIEYIAGECDVLADVHFDISESPQFYMMQQQQEQQNNNNKDDISTNEEEWIQCSDFTENKQASRFFRHSLKGVAHHMKQELLSLMEKHEETHRLVRFIETPIPTALTAAYQPNMIVEDTMFNPQATASSYMYWNQMASTPFMAEPCSFLS